MRNRSIVAVLAWLICLGTAIRGQVAEGPAAALTGVVRDEGRLPLPGATVTATTQEGAVLAAVETGLDGAWSMSELPAGPIGLTVRLAGFRTVATRAIAAVSTPPIVVTLELAGYTDAVTVTASRGERDLASVPGSVSVVSGPALDQARGLNLVESLTFVPGVSAGDVSGVDDLRISIRGAGVRAGFGSRGVVLMVDGVPITEPDGQTPHVDGQIDLAGAERIEVVRGPASALYGGAALGGVVNVVSRVPAREPQGRLRVEAGAFRFGRAHAAASAGAGPAILNGSLSFSHLDGFRVHNSLRSWTGTAQGHWTNGSSRAVFSALVADAALDLPGTLTHQQFRDDPAQARDINVANDWRRDNRVFRAGGQYERQWGSGHGLEVSSHVQTRDLLHPIFVVIEQNALRHLGSVRYRLGRGRHVLTTGADLDTQWVDDRWFVNEGGIPGARIRNDRDTVRSAGVFAQDEIILANEAGLTIGVRADAISYDLVDRDRDDGDASDTRSFARVSPKLGLTARIGNRLIAFGNLATGFEAPTLGEVRLPAGFNETVRPQKSVSLEGGLRGEIGPIGFDAALYRMEVDDEILPETVNNVTVYRNVAHASHLGLELSMRVRGRGPLSMEGTYAWSRFVLDDFGTFSGNRLPGVPAHAGTLRASYVHPSGWDGSATLVLASRAFVNDANTEAADRYTVIAAAVGYRTGRLRVFVRGENVGDARYTSRPQVNDAGGFYYYPAPGRHASAGVDVAW